MALAFVLGAAPWCQAADSSRVKALFKDPPREYSTGPLWVWNDMLTEQQIRDTLRDLAAQKVKQVWVHPRPGMMTPYLSADWFRLWRVSLEEARRLDMNVWIYDENSYPSGFAGGWVPELMPESRGRGLAINETKAPPKWSDNLIGVYRLNDDTFENVTARIKAGEALPEGRFVVASEVRAGNSPWHGNRCYVNLLSPGVTEKFLEVTMGAYKRELGKEFGGRVPGVFTDEPNIHPAGGLPWSEILASEFQKRWGYNLLDHLPSLTRPIGDWRKIRHNYYQVLNEQFIEHWARPNHDYCETNHLEWTGHYWDHEWPNCAGVPDNMAMYAWHQRPSIDCLMNQYAENTHAQFGNARMAREVSSIANQLGYKRTLCEIYGAGGWDLRFEDMKRIGDWLEVLGVNTLNQHLSYVTLRGARKRDHPQSFSYHEPWWSAYHVSAEYLARLSAALSQGDQINDILVLEPTTTAWMYQGDGKLGEVGDSFFKLVMALEAAQVEYDIGSEDVLARHGSVDAAGLKVGQRHYRAVVLPPVNENLNAKTAQMLAIFVNAGGTLLNYGAPPSRIDGALPTSLGPELADAAFWKTASSDALPKGLPSAGALTRFMPQVLPPVSLRIPPASAAKGLGITRAEGDQGILFHMRRHIDDGEILFLVNTSIESPSTGTIQSDLTGAEAWNLYTGKAEPYPFAKRPQNGITASFNLPPSGSLLLFLSRKPIASRQPVAENIALIKPQGSPEIRRVEPNVLTLDYVDVTAGGETRSNLYFYQANQFAWQKNGLPRNPWDSAVQFKDELISKKFPADSGFEARYHFVLESAPPANLAFVLERPDLYTITCNGQTVTATPNAWWLDKAFGRIPLSKAARTGENVITIKAAPFTMFHELEPAYLLGDFTLRPADHGFVVVADHPLTLGAAAAAKPATHSFNPEGTMWLTAGIGFSQNNRGRNKDDRAPFIIFDLGRPTDLSSLRIWNYNENHVRDLTSRGVSKFRVTAAASEPDASSTVLGTWDLPRAKGAGELPVSFPVTARGVRYVRFDILANQNGVTYPAAGEPDDNGFVGLAEVQFFTSAEQRLEGVKVHRVSSELPTHRRFARCLVDGSGLDSGASGWNGQGHPFYSGPVVYRERFDLTRKAGRYVVALPNWRGSVAQITVNRKPAGYIDAPPFECDVTPFIKGGQNDVAVTIIGTLKNTLGPHHGNPALGAAWPSAFQHGPNPGPPPGNAYSTVAYGLFEPFVLKQVTPVSNKRR